MVLYYETENSVYYKVMTLENPQTCLFRKNPKRGKQKTIENRFYVLSC